MGRNRTLSGTRLIPLRISIALIHALDEWAEEEELSRNTLMARGLATLVLGRERPKADPKSSPQT